MNRTKVYNVFTECLIVISFVMSVFTNIISFYLTGNDNDMVRKGISWSLIFIVTLFLVISAFAKWLAADKVTKRSVLLCIIPLVINGIVLVWALISSSFNSIVLKQCVSFGAYCVPIVCGAIYMVLENKIESVVSKVKYVSSVMMPFYCISIMYFWKMTPETSLSEGIGGMVYLTIGYSAIPIYAFLLFDLIILFMNQERKKWKIALVLLEMALCSLIVIGSGSRGVLLAWLVINFVALFIMLLKKERKAIIGIFVGVLSVVLFCIMAPDNNGAIARQFAFVNELKSGSLKQSLVSEEGQELLNEMFVQAEGEKGMEEIAKEIRNELSESEKTSQVKEEVGILNIKENEEQVNELNSNNNENQEKIELPESAQSSNEEKEGNVEQESVVDLEYQQRYEDAVFSVTNGSMARSYLWQLAIKEMRQNPITGMGALGYQLKYKGYTHNILLECMADFGIIVFAVFTVACVAMFCCLIKFSIKDWIYAGILVVLSGEGTRAMLSGNLYVCPFLLFAFAIVILKVLQEKKKNTIKIQEES